MGTPEHFPIAGPVDIHEPLTTKSYEELLYTAKALGAEIGVPYDMYDTTLRMLDELHDFDAATAAECVQDLPFALATADVLIRFYDNPKVDKSCVWSASLLADIGKQMVPKELLDESHQGTVLWTPGRFEAMKPHAVAGAYMAQRNGLPAPVVRAIAEHHGKQRGNGCYGECPVLVDYERTTRDCVTTGDFFEAMMGRNNTRNAQLSREERLFNSFGHVSFVFNDYWRGDELAEAVFKELLTTTV